MRRPPLLPSGLRWLSAGHTAQIAEIDLDSFGELAYPASYIRQLHKPAAGRYLAVSERAGAPTAPVAGDEDDPALVPREAPKVDGYVAVRLVARGSAAAREAAAEARELAVREGDAPAELAPASQTHVEVLSIAVAREARGRGLGRRLLRAARAMAAQLGGRHLRLHVHVGNEAAQRLYASEGFVVLGLAPEYYNGEGEDALVCAGPVRAPSPPSEEEEPVAMRVRLRMRR